MEGLVKANEVVLTSNLYKEWLGFADIKEKSISTYNYALKQLFGYFEQNNIKRPEKQDILNFKKELEKDHKATTINNYLVATKQFFKYLEEQGIYKDIAKNVKNVKVENNFKKDYLTIKQCSELLNSVDRATEQGKRDYAILLLMLTTGLRTIEVVRADIQDIKPYGNDLALYVQGKGRDEKSELVKVENEVFKAICEYLETRTDKEPSQPLFTCISNKNKGGRLTTKSISRLVKEHLKGIGLNSERLTAHSLRHTTATQNLLNGGTPEETQQLLRHKNLNTTMIYSHNLERLNNKSEARVLKAIMGE